MNSAVKRLGIFLVFSIFLSNCAMKEEDSFSQRITTIKAAPDIAVNVTYHEGVFWKAVIKNQRSETVKVMWDDSRYINSSQRSSRLIPKKYTKLPSDQRQSPTIIPPGVEFTELFTADDLMSYIDSDVVPVPSDLTKHSNMSLVFSSDGYRTRWQGRLDFEQEKKE